MPPTVSLLDRKSPCWRWHSGIGSLLGRGVGRRNTRLPADLLGSILIRSRRCFLPHRLLSCISWREVRRRDIHVSGDLSNPTRERIRVCRVNRLRGPGVPTAPPPPPSHPPPPPQPPPPPPPPPLNLLLRPLKLLYLLGLVLLFIIPLLDTCSQYVKNWKSWLASPSDRSACRPMLLPRRLWYISSIPGFRVSDPRPSTSRIHPWLLRIYVQSRGPVRGRSVFRASRDGLSIYRVLEQDKVVTISPFVWDLYQSTCLGSERLLSSFGDDFPR